MELRIEYAEVKRRAELAMWKAARVVGEADGYRRKLLLAVCDDDVYARRVLFGESLSAMSRKMSGYVCSVAVDESGYTVSLSLPADFRESNVPALLAALTEYTVDMGLYKWLLDFMPDLAAVRLEEAQNKLIEAKTIISYRSVPPRIEGFI